jgi:BlaI family transcriptional regulator, penicillinase repressor
MERPVPRRLAARPTNAELAILRVLWLRGPSTVRAVHESLKRADPVGYTTVLKLLQIMSEKGLVTRDASARSHVYEAAASETITQRRMLRDLAERAFGGSTVGLVLHALSTTPATPQELQQIRQLLDEKKGAKA